ncbi:hypothetical protein [uncultured Alistipes sp.]|uniref:hypothetical protein n=1 Tax=uncultured Alistipes sp. TaxID=538949 RepID=UPI002637DD3C|nr:hypothetical protein [uncultured Alistipes sp.]
MKNNLNALRKTQQTHRNREFLRENFRKKLCEIKSKHYICIAFHTDRRVPLVITGIFYAHTIRFCTPVWCVNAPTAYLVESNGKGRTVFNFCQN